LALWAKLFSVALMVHSSGSNKKPGEVRRVFALGREDQ